MAEKPDPMPEGSGRNPQEYGVGVSSAAAGKAEPRPEDEKLIEEVVESKNLRKAYLWILRDPQYSPRAGKLDPKALAVFPMEAVEAREGPLQANAEKGDRQRAGGAHGRERTRPLATEQ